MMLVVDLPDTRPLGIDDFDAILSLLSPLSRRWEDIAIQLDVDTRQLPSMENTSESNAVMLRMMLQKLQGVAPPPTLHDLVDALSSFTIGQRAYAEELKQKYCPSGKRLICTGTLHFKVFFISSFYSIFFIFIPPHCLNAPTTGSSNNVLLFPPGTLINGVRGGRGWEYIVFALAGSHICTW